MRVPIDNFWAGSWVKVCGDFEAKKKNIGGTDEDEGDVGDPQ